MKQQKTARKLALLLSMYGALLIFLSTTNPRNLHPLLLVLPVLWLFAALTISIFWMSKYVLPNSSNESSSKLLGKALLFAGIPSGLLLLQSIDQLTAKDIFLVGLFGVIAVTYSRRFQLARKRE
jgi:hypothetical protein